MDTGLPVGYLTFSGYGALQPLWTQPLACTCAGRCRSAVALPPRIDVGPPPAPTAAAGGAGRVDRDRHGLGSRAAPRDVAIRSFRIAVTVAHGAVIELLDIRLVVASVLCCAWIMLLHGRLSSSYAALKVQRLTDRFTTVTRCDSPVRWL